MSATEQLAVTSGKVSRRVPRHPVAVPVDLTVLRSGIPDRIPGRSIEVSERGLCAVLAGELRAGDAVGVEFRLPEVSLPIRARAVVRHHSRLRCGLEFQSLPPEQETIIRYWAARAAKGPVASAELPSFAVKPKPAVRSRWWQRRYLRPLLAASLLVFVLVGLIGWWRWYAAWQELESRLPARQAPAAETPQATVSPALVEQLLTHRVEPVYPEAARRSRLQGTVVLDTVIGPDGSVVHVHPVSGPEVLAQAAEDAVKWWRFQPYRVNGKPTQVETVVAVEFRP